MNYFKTCPKMGNLGDSSVLHLPGFLHLESWGQNRIKCSKHYLGIWVSRLRDPGLQLWLVQTYSSSSKPIYTSLARQGYLKRLWSWLISSSCINRGKQWENNLRKANNNKAITLPMTFFSSRLFTSLFFTRFQSKFNFRFLCKILETTAYLKWNVLFCIWGFLDWGEICAWTEGIWFWGKRGGQKSFKSVNLLWNGNLQAREVKWYVQGHRNGMEQSGLGWKFPAFICCKFFWTSFMASYQRSLLESI